MSSAPPGASGGASSSSSFGGAAHEVRGLQDQLRVTRAKLRESEARVGRLQRSAHRLNQPPLSSGGAGRAAVPSAGFAAAEWAGVGAGMGEEGRGRETWAVPELGPRGEAPPDSAPSAWYAADYHLDYHFRASECRGILSQRVRIASMDEEYAFVKYDRGKVTTSHLASH